MKLTKGKKMYNKKKQTLKKMYNKKKQTLKKIHKKTKSSYKKNTFKKSKKANLARKTFRKGGNDNDEKEKEKTDLYLPPYRNVDLYEEEEEGPVKMSSRGMVLEGQERESRGPFLHETYEHESEGPVKMSSRGMVLEGQERDSRGPFLHETYEHESEGPVKMSSRGKPLDEMYEYESEEE